MQGSARKDVVFGAAGVYPVTVPGPKWKSWLRTDGRLMTPLRIFISSVQKELAREREALRDYLRGDSLT